MKIQVTREETIGLGYADWTKVGGSDNSICLRKGEWKVWVKGRSRKTEKLIQLIREHIAVMPQTQNK